MVGPFHGGSAGSSYWAAGLQQPFGVLTVSGRVPAASPDTRHRRHCTDDGGGGVCAAAANTITDWTFAVGIGVVGRGSRRTDAKG